MALTTRRHFVSAVGALAGAALFPEVAAADPAVQRGWDLAWLDDLQGKHRQVFDLGQMDALVVVRNWYKAHLDVLGLKGKELNAVVGIGGSSFPVNASSALFETFPIGELWKVNDPESGKPATRNIYLDGGKSATEQESTVRALRERGTIFWQCNNALQGAAFRVAQAVGRTQPEVYAELKSGLHPWVILVPAHTMLIGLAQEHGCAYQSL